jgi:deoxyribodipyrimidine photo-lyase
MRKVAGGRQAFASASALSLFATPLSRAALATASSMTSYRYCDVPVRHAHRAAPLMSNSGSPGDGDHVGGRGGRGDERRGARSRGRRAGRGRGGSGGGGGAKRYTGDPMAGAKVVPVAAPESYNGKGAAIMWFRNDLRIEDNAAVSLADTAEILVPVYVFDVRQYGMGHPSPHGFQRTGPYRTQFIVESAKALRTALRWKMSDLVVRVGLTEDAIADIAQCLVDAGHGPVRVVAHKEVTREETDVERAVAAALTEVEAPEGREDGFVPVAMDFVWGATMLHPDDLAFNPAGPALPPSFTRFRETVEAQPAVPVRPEIPAPETFSDFPRELKLASDDWPSLGGDLKVEGLAAPLDYAFPHPRACCSFPGGEKAGVERVEEWIFKKRRLSHYFESRNDSGTMDDSSKFSPWLALGCISPRTVYWACKRYEETVEANKSTYWMVFELLTRDYFHWVAAQAGDKLFALNGFTGRAGGEQDVWRLPPDAVQPADKARLEAWIAGRTGAPFVDAAMRELASTGFMSNRSRQNAASFLIHDIKYPDWRAGAEYFESQLIDHDVASNWGNWAYIAGVGSDPRGGRRFNVVKQAMQYDPTGWYTKRWCDELQDVPPPWVHEPHQLPEEDCEAVGLVRGETYPLPIVPLLRAPGHTRPPPLGKVSGLDDHVLPVNDPDISPEELEGMREEARAILEVMTVRPGASDAPEGTGWDSAAEVEAREEAKKYE